MDELQRDIENALNANVEMSEEEYKAMCQEMDKSTAMHGVEGKAPLSEAKRHKRVQSNFYATALNILVNMYQLLAELEADVKELKGDKKNG